MKNKRLLLLVDVAIALAVSAVYTNTSGAPFVSNNELSILDNLSTRQRWLIFPRRRRWRIQCGAFVRPFAQLDAGSEFCAQRAHLLKLSMSLTPGTTPRRALCLSGFCAGHEH